MILWSKALRSNSGTFRRSWPLRKSRSKVTITIFFGLPLEFVLQNREIRGAVLCRDHDLAIDDRRPGVYVPGIGRDLSETIGPVSTAPGEYLDSSVPEMDLDPVTVELDLMHPALARGHLVD